MVQASFYDIPELFLKNIQEIVAAINLLFSGWLKYVKMVKKLNHLFTNSCSF